MEKIKKESRSYLNTVELSLGIVAGMVALAIIGSEVTDYVFENTGTEISNSNVNSDEIEKSVVENPTMGYIELAVVAPVTEELIFRGIPSGIVSSVENKIGKERGGAWGTGVATSSTFALAHNFRN